MPKGLILNKKDMCLPHVSLIFKTISPKTFGLHYVGRITRSDGSELAQSAQ